MGGAWGEEEEEEREGEGSLEEEAVEEEEGGEELAWRLTKSIWGRYSRVWVLGTLDRRRQNPKPTACAGLCRD